MWILTTFSLFQVRSSEPPADPGARSTVLGSAVRDTGYFPTTFPIVDYSPDILPSSKILVRLGTRGCIAQSQHTSFTNALATPSISPRQLEFQTLGVANLDNWKGKPNVSRPDLVLKN